MRSRRSGPTGRSSLIVTNNDDATDSYRRVCWPKPCDAWHAGGEAMSRVPKDEEARLAAEFERDAENDELWEEVPSPTPSDHRRTHGTQAPGRPDRRSCQQWRETARERGARSSALLR